MLRLFACAAMALVIGAGAGLADEKKAPKKPAKKPAGVVGQVVSCESGTLKIKVKKEEKEFKLTDETPVLIGQGKKAEKLTFSSAKGKLTKGARVRVTLTEDGSVKQVNVLPARKKPKTDK